MEKQFKITIQTRRRDKYDVTLFFRPVKGAKRSTRIAEFPLTDTGMYALSQLLGAMMYDVHDRVVLVEGLFNDLPSGIEPDVKAEQLLLEFHALKAAPRLVLRPLNA